MALGREMEEGMEHRTVSVNGIKMHIVEKGEGPTVLLLHGFPQLWYSWRHQIHGLAARGFRALAPDLRGFGDTDAPPSTSSYTIYHIVGDLIALIDLLGQDKVLRKRGRKNRTVRLSPKPSTSSPKIWTFAPLKKPPELWSLGYSGFIA